MSNFKMNPAIKKLWLKALRSGEYSQTQGYLLRRKPDGSDNFCCLGVLCNLYAQKNPGTGFVSTHEGRQVQYSMLQPGEAAKVNLGETVFKFSGESWELPPNVRSWAGFPDDFSEKAQDAIGPSITPMSALMEANDAGQSFKTIAKLIEKYL